MMKPLLNAMRLQAQRQASSRQETTVGEVTSYDPANFSVRVQLQAEEILTGWLPLCSPWIGNSWGMFAAPSVGDMVAVHFFGADLEAGFVEGRIFNDVDRPLSVPSGEFWLVHQSGSFLKFTSDGNVSVNTANDLVATVGNNLSATVTGDAGITVDGDATLTVNGNANATIGGDATVGVTGNLEATAAKAIVNAPTTINGTLAVNGNTTITGTATVDGTTILNGPLSQGAGGTSTSASLIGPLNVINDISANGTSLHTHKHGGVQTGAGSTGVPL